MDSQTKWPVLNYLKKFLISQNEINSTHMKYPTAIAQTLQFKIVRVEKQEASVEVYADPSLHGNQQGTIHGGFLCELADAAIGTAHSTIMQEGQSFTTLELKANFIRPSWKTKLTAHAKPIYAGNTITHYQCEIFNNDQKLVATIISTVMTLTGTKAQGR